MDLGKQQLPSYIPIQTGQARGARRSTSILRLTLLGILTFVFIHASSVFHLKSPSSSTIPIHAFETLQKCRHLHTKPGPPPDFNLREHSDRFVPGTRATLLKNASIWTGRAKGLEIIEGDLLLDQGLIKAIGMIAPKVLEEYTDLVTFDLHGAWVTPGIVDLHSHLGVDSAPKLSGASDTNSFKGIIQPWLRSVDGLNTHDEAFLLSISGGVTTSVVLPGSANAIGGQAFVIKLRPTTERSTSSMLLEPPYSLNGSHVDPSLPPRWRQMKHACGENPSRIYDGTRMDTIWSFREGYNTARQIKESQDKYCSKAVAGEWDSLGEFPEDLRWEALVDVLRGRVKVQTHCYEAVDLDGLVRLSNEFKFPIAAFHHASEAYLVPDLLKKAYEHPPAVALFATNGRYKREAYRASEFAPRILADNGLKVVMKSDHPVLNSRYLLYEAQQAHYYGLPANLALASVTSTSAEVMGQDHRIGFIKEGYDADVVVWDSHPLALGATPKQVWIDGIAQIDSPFSTQKPASFQKSPATPNFDKEAYEALKYDGLPPLKTGRTTSGVVIFTNVTDVYIRSEGSIREVYSGVVTPSSRIVVVDKGAIVCDGSEPLCYQNFEGIEAEYVNLEGGSLSPGLTSFGSPLALEDIQGEPDTSDGYVYDPFKEDSPGIIKRIIIRAVDGLQFAARDTLYAYQAGVTMGITAPKSRGFLSGLSAAFATGAGHKLEKGAVVQDIAALHIRVGHVSSSPSVSTQISALRRLLLGTNVRSPLSELFQQVVSGSIPLAVSVENADIMASLILLKQEVEAQNGKTIQLTFTGAAEAHFLAKEIGQNKIGVVLTPSRPFPGTWESRRILPGPPLSQDSAISILLRHNITVGIGIKEQWSARNTRFDIAWAALEAHGEISKTEALALASVNLEKLLGVNVGPLQSDLVATRGGTLLDFSSRVVSIISSARGFVDLM